MAAIGAIPTGVNGLLFLARGVFAVTTGAVATLGLFYIMQSLIDRGEKVIVEVSPIQITDMLRVKEERFLEVKKRKAEKPPEPDELPDVPPQDTFRVSTSDTSYQMSNLKLDHQMDIGSNNYAVTDSEYLPIVKVLPVYPQRAAARSMIGWVLVEFTVSERGMVVDPFVVENCAIYSPALSTLECRDQPNSIFDRSALKAALKFKYVPRTVDGVAIATMGVRNLITFQFDE